RFRFMRQASTVGAAPNQMNRLTVTDRSNLQEKKEMKTHKYPQVVTWLTMVAILVSMCAGLTFGRRAAAQSNEQAQATSDREIETTDSQYPVLSKYATDLTLLARRGKLETARGYETDVARVI